MAGNQNNAFLRNLQLYQNRTKNKNEENINNNNGYTLSRLFNYAEEHYPHHMNSNNFLNSVKREILAKRSNVKKTRMNVPTKNQENAFIKLLNANNVNLNSNNINQNRENAKMNFVEKYYPHLAQKMQDINYEGNVFMNVKKDILAKRAKKSATSWLGKVRKRLTQPRVAGNVAARNIKLPRFGINRARKSNTNVRWGALKVNEGNLVQNGSSGVSQVWLRKQANYIKGLNDYDFKTLLAYTLNSSLWVGKYERTGNVPNIRNYYNTFNYSVLNAANKKKAMRNLKWVTKPLLPQIQKILNDPTANIQRLKNNSLHRKALDMYRADLHRIIRNAPALPANMIVYRGLSTDPFKGSKGIIHRVKGFSSASYLASWGSYYARGGTEPQLQRIKLLRGTHVIAAAILNPWETGGQGEIIINSGSRYIIRTRNVLRHVVQPFGSERMRVTDVTVIPDGPSNKNINKE